MRWRHLEVEFEERRAGVFIWKITHSFHRYLLIFLQTRLERKEALFKKKRARSALNKNVQSIDMGLYPQDSVSNVLKPAQITKPPPRTLPTMMDSSPAQCGGNQQIRWSIFKSFKPSSERVTVLTWDNKGWTMQLSKQTLRRDQHPR